MSKCEKCGIDPRDVVPLSIDGKSVFIDGRGDVPLLLDGAEEIARLERELLIVTAQRDYMMKALLFTEDQSCKTSSPRVLGRIGVGRIGERCRQCGANPPWDKCGSQFCPARSAEGK